MTKHMTGDSKVERDLRKGKKAPQKLTERTMTDFMRDELGAPKVVDRSTFHAVRCAVTRGGGVDCQPALSTLSDRG
jgi:hypothetical protein